MVYEIWYLVYKMSIKFMIQFCKLKLHLGRLHVSNPQIWIADSGRRKGLQNLALGVQNCTKWVQNYDPVFYVKTALGGGVGRCMSPTLQIWIADSGRRKVYKIYELLKKLYKISTKLIMIKFFMLNCIGVRVGVAACLQSSNVELRKSEERMCSKFWTWCTKLCKMSTKLWSSFLCWGCNWGAACHQLPNLNCR